LKQLTVSFDNAKRNTGEKMYLDVDKVNELAAYYEELHRDNEK